MYGYALVPWCVLMFVAGVAPRVSRLAVRIVRFGSVEVGPTITLLVEWDPAAVGSGPGKNILENLPDGTALVPRARESSWPARPHKRCTGLRKKNKEQCRRPERALGLQDHTNVARARESSWPARPHKRCTGLRKKNKEQCCRPERALGLQDPKRCTGLRRRTRSNVVGQKLACKTTQTLHGSKEEEQGAMLWKRLLACKTTQTLHGSKEEEQGAIPHKRCTGLRKKNKEQCCRPERALGLQDHTNVARAEELLLQDHTTWVWKKNKCRQNPARPHKRCTGLRKKNKEQCCRPGRALGLQDHKRCGLRKNKEQCCRPELLACKTTQTLHGSKEEEQGAIPHKRCTGLRKKNKEQCCRPEELLACKTTQTLHGSKEEEQGAIPHKRCTGLRKKNKEQCCRPESSWPARPHKRCTGLRKKNKEQCCRPERALGLQDHNKRCTGLRKKNKEQCCRPERALGLQDHTSK
ncbi:hypothetical protein J6590_031453 [Homalodisca vitripennis]|nr:hypothetical protein J6590_031453 [Homalodisca vitripennis]